MVELVTPESLGIQCPKCGSTDNECKDSRPQPGGVRRRRLVCKSCAMRFSSVELRLDKWTPRKTKYHVGQRVRTVANYHFRFRGTIVAIYSVLTGYNRFVVLDSNNVDLPFWASNLEVDL